MSLIKEDQRMEKCIHKLQRNAPKKSCEKRRAV